MYMCVGVCSYLYVCIYMCMCIRCAVGDKSVVTTIFFIYNYFIRFTCVSLCVSALCVCLSLCV